MTKEIFKECMNIWIQKVIGESEIRFSCREMTLDDTIELFNYNKLINEHEHQHQRCILESIKK